MINSTDLITLYGKTYTAHQITHEKQEFIRLEAVNYNFALNELARDASALIRTAVAKKQAAHEILAYDKNWRVRAAVAQHCTDIERLNHLARDRNDFVRFIVAKRGFAAQYLIDDPDREIADLARQALQQQRQAA